MMHIRGVADLNKQPFNAFLSGFSATVGQFVLTASLRIQTNVENKADFTSVSHER
jgi:oligosaccharyltransferase complex subunit epsilon